MKVKNAISLILTICMCLSFIPGKSQTVYAGETDAAWMRISNDKLSLKVGDTADLTSFVLPYSVTNRGITWTSSDNDVVSIGTAGKDGRGTSGTVVITAVSAGVATITATSDAKPSISITSEVEVYSAAPSTTFYYVSPTGEDNNDGSENSPFKTIEKARDTIRALNGNIPDGGITVYLRGGEYPVSSTIEFTPADSGKSGKPIVYKAYNDETPIITGGVELDNWTKLSNADPNYDLIPDNAKGKVYVADIAKGWRFHDLYVNDERQQVSRQINSSVWATWKRGTVAPTTVDGQTMTFANGDLIGLDGNKDIEINWMPVVFWNGLAVATNINSSANTALIKSKNLVAFGLDSPYYNIMNAPTYLDVAGEWSVDSANGKVYYWPYDNNMDGKKVIAPKPYELIRFQGDREAENWGNLVSHITLSGLTIEYSDRLAEDMWDDEWLKRNAENPDAAVFMQSVYNNTIENSIIRHTGAYAIALDEWAQSTKIISNELADLGSGGVQIYGFGPGKTDKNKSNIVMYNNIHDIGLAPYLHSPAVTIFGSSFNRVDYNFVRNMPYVAFSAVGTDHNSMSKITENVRASFDTFGNKSSQYNIRFDELKDEYGEYIDFTSDPEFAREFQLSDYNSFSNNIVEEFMLYMDDGGALYSWYSGKYNKWNNNTIYKSSPGLHQFWPLYMDNYADFSELKGNRVWTMQQNEADRGNEWTPSGNNYFIDNNYGWPDKPDGFETLFTANYAAMKSNGILGMSPSKPIINPPSAYTLPITLSWQSARGAAKYILEIADDANMASIVYTNELTRNYDIVSSLAEDTQYYYRVKAVGLLGDEEASDVQSLTTTYKQKLSPPKNVNLQASFDNITVTWDQDAPNELYTVYRVENGVETEVATDITKPFYADLGVVSGNSYSYRILRKLDDIMSAKEETNSVIARGTKILFEDDFSEPKTEWKYAYAGPEDIYDGVLNISKPSQSWAEYLLYGDETWKDYVVEFDMQWNGWEPPNAENAQGLYSGIGFYTRYLPPGVNGKAYKQTYNLNIRKSSKVDLKYNPGNDIWTDIFNESYDVSDIFKADITNKLRIEHLGKQLKVFVNNNLYFIVEDPNNYGTYGGVGIAVAQFHGTVDNFKVYSENEINTFITTFEVEGKTRTVETVVGESIVMPQAPVKKGAKFAGWFTASTGGDQVTTYEAAQTVFAQFLPKTPVAIIGVDISNKEYDGQPVAFSGTPTTGEYTGELVYHYTSIDAGTYDSATPPTQPGWYAIQIMIPENDEIYTGELVKEFRITRRSVKITGLTATDREYDGTTTVAITGGEIGRKIITDDVTADFPTTGTIESAAAGNNKIVRFDRIYLKGADKDKYLLTEQPISYVNIAPTEGEAETFTATIQAGTGGSITTGTSGSYAAGTIITLEASANSGYEFSGWVSSGGGTFANANSSLTTFAMPATDVAITGEFILVGDNGGETTPEPKPEPKPEPISPETGNTITVQATTDSVTGAVIAKIEEREFNNLTDRVKLAGSSGGSGIAEIKVEVSKDANSVAVEIPRDAFNKLAEETDADIRIDANIGTVTFSAKAIESISSAASTGNITIGINKVDKNTLTPEVRAKVGDRSVYDFSVTAGSSLISHFGGGYAKISIPYTPRPGEKENSIIVYYIDNAGRFVTVRGNYDSATGTVYFRTTHFSQFVVGYNEVSFKDVAANAWYNEAVSFISARGIIHGVGGDRFAPGDNVTRADFLIMVMNAYGIELDATITDNFADAGSKYYTPYLATAKHLGLVSGAGENQYAPESTISRQDMFVILYRVLGNLGELPTSTDGKTLGSFNDGGDIAGYANDAMKLFVETGIISGDGKKLTPKATSTRAQATQVLYNLLSK